jgi:HEPN domain-containing protein
VLSPSPEQREYAALLIAKATGDKQAAFALARAGVVAEVVGFHAQQAVEKATKAVLVLAGVSIPHTHDLERLLELASECGWPSPTGVAEAGWLTPWGVQFRYDEVVEDLDQAAALDAADAAVQWAVQTIESL